MFQLASLNIACVALEQYEFSLRESANADTELYSY